MVDRATVGVALGVLLTSLAAEAEVLALPPTYEQGFATQILAPASTTISIPTGIAPQAGDLLFVAVGISPQTPDLVTFDDNLGNSYLQAHALEGLGLSRYGSYFVVNRNPGVLTLNLVLDQPATNIDVQVLRYSGIRITAPVDHTSRGASSADFAMGCDLTTTQPGDLLLAFMPSAGTGTVPGGATGGTVRSQLGGDIVVEQFATNPGLYTVGANTDGPPWVAHCVAFVPRNPVVSVDSGSGGDAGDDGGSDAGGTLGDAGVNDRDAGSRDGDAGAQMLPLTSDLGCSTSEGAISLAALVVVLAVLLRRGRFVGGREKL